LEIVTPESYRGWRASPLGSITEELEQQLVFEMAGDLSGARLLDIGCGDGAYAVLAAKRGARVVGVDASDGMLEAARENARSANVEVGFHRADARTLPFADGVFDLAIAVTVLCFQKDPGPLLNEMARVLAPGGRLVIGELGKWSTWSFLRRIRSWFGSPAWRQARFRSALQLRREIERAGARIEHVRGCIYYPPVSFAARLLSPFDRLPSSLTTLGAAFIAISARRKP